jgi:wyosine [tRNA(Phe)-imidazoG37] synthetase (radical SAM superfamily)
MTKLKESVCEYCGKKIDKTRNSKYCSTDCLYCVILLRKVKNKLERHNKSKIKEIIIVDSKGRKIVKIK